MTKKAAIRPNRKIKVPGLRTMHPKCKCGHYSREHANYGKGACVNEHCQCAAFERKSDQPSSRSRVPVTPADIKREEAIRDSFARTALHALLSVPTSVSFNQISVQGPRVLQDPPPTPKEERIFNERLADIAFSIADACMKRRAQ